MPILDDMNMERVERFWGKVDIQSPSECWHWLGSTRGAGYGQFKVGRRTCWAHRVAYTLCYEEEIDGLVARHTCDNPSCCNPHHLLSGTLADNVADRVARERSAFGTKNCNAKLTEDAVRAIRKDPRSVKEIAEEYGLHHTNILRVKQRQSWRHVR